MHKRCLRHHFNEDGCIIWHFNLPNDFVIHYLAPEVWPLWHCGCFFLLTIWGKNFQSKRCSEIYNVWYAGGVRCKTFTLLRGKHTSRKPVKSLPSYYHVAARLMMVEGRSVCALLRPAVKVKYCLMAAMLWVYLQVGVELSPAKDFWVLNQYNFCTLKMIDCFAAARAWPHIAARNNVFLHFLRLQVHVLVKEKQVKHA